MGESQLPKSSKISNLRNMAVQARQSAAGAVNVGARQEFLCLAAKLEAAAAAEKKEVPHEDPKIRWPFR